MQAYAFLRLGYQRRVLFGLYSYKQERQKMRSNYSRMSRVYKSQLKQKGLMVLQWNSMRARYQYGLIEKSDASNLRRLKKKLFSVLKRLLIMKYAETHISQKREYQMLGDYLNAWRAAFYERLSATEGESQT